MHDETETEQKQNKFVSFLFQTRNYLSACRSTVSSRPVYLVI